MGTYVEKPSLKVDWEQYADHATNDSMVKRGINQEMVDSYVANGKACLLYTSPSPRDTR